MLENLYENSRYMNSKTYFIILYYIAVKKNIHCDSKILTKKERQGLQGLGVLTPNSKNHDWPLTPGI